MGGKTIHRKHPDVVDLHQIVHEFCVISHTFLCASTQLLMVLVLYPPDNCGFSSEVFYNQSG